MRGKSRTSTKWESKCIGSHLLITAMVTRMRLSCQKCKAIARERKKMKRNKVRAMLVTR